ncbi:MAG: hypothetical protein KAS75_06050 [Planctomycetes bacterium]|nr:hypothetical protein [Planctomycetota bacterium]
MKTTVTIAKTLFICLLLLAPGCEPAETTPQTKPHTSTTKHFSYNPVKVDIMPLTGFVYDATENKNLLRVYVSLLDSFDSQIKSPGTFRFELYKKLQRTADPKGKRLAIWPDINLTDQTTNNNYWLDFLRVYEFNLELEPKDRQTYILQATCICPNGQRLTTEFAFKYIE